MIFASRREERRWPRSPRNLRADQQRTVGNSSEATATRRKSSAWNALFWRSNVIDCVVILLMLVNEHEQYNHACQFFEILWIFNIRA